jgi:hypothetical protein
MTTGCRPEQPVDAAVLRLHNSISRRTNKSHATLVARAPLVRRDILVYKQSVLQIAV